MMEQQKFGHAAILRSGLTGGPPNLLGKCRVREREGSAPSAYLTLRNLSADSLLGSPQCLAIRRDNAPARSRSLPTRALERRARRDRAPKAVCYAEHPLDDELDEVMRQVARS
jgi:hypothetical protein